MLRRYVVPARELTVTGASLPIDEMSRGDVDESHPMHGPFLPPCVASHSRALSVPWGLSAPTRGVDCVLELVEVAPVVRPDTRRVLGKVTSRTSAVAVGAIGKVVRRARRATRTARGGPCFSTVHVAWCRRDETGSRPQSTRAAGDITGAENQSAQALNKSAHR